MLAAASLNAPGQPSIMAIYSDLLALPRCTLLQEVRYQMSIGRFVGISAAGLATSLAWSQYDVTVLNPVGYGECRVYGISGNSQVGSLAVGGPPPDFAHAAIWSGSPGAVDLNPVGAVESAAYGVSGNNQVGFYGGATTAHAALWHGTAASLVDLNPAGFSNSWAYATTDTSQVGYGLPLINVDLLRHPHALLWEGDAASVVDLTPRGYSWCIALGVSGYSQVGDGMLPKFGREHAVLWNGSASSAVDLNPSGFVSSCAYAVSGDYQAGSAYTGEWDHAFLWNGSAASGVDLNPAGYESSVAQAILGGVQVGYALAGYAGGGYAMLWRGSASSAVNLHAYLINASLNGSPLVLGGSTATGINSDGSIVGFAGDSSGSGRVLAVVWTPSKKLVVEPSDFTWTVGHHVWGGLFELGLSDSAWADVVSLPSGSNSVVQLVVDGESPVSTASDLRFDLVGLTSVGGVSQTIELFDWSASAYVMVDSRQAAQADTTVEVTAPKPNRFIQPGTRALRARISYVAQAGSFHAYTDATVWRVIP